MSKINDEDRRQWVLNDEGLYNLYRASGRSVREFVRQNRPEIDAVIDNIVSGQKPAHYLVYGGGR